MKPEQMSDDELSEILECESLHEITEAKLKERFLKAFQDLFNFVEGVDENGESIDLSETHDTGNVYWTKPKDFAGEPYPPTGNDDFFFATTYGKYCLDIKLEKLKEH